MLLIHKQRYIECYQKRKRKSKSKNLSYTYQQVKKLHTNNRAIELSPMKVDFVLKSD